MAAEVWTVGKLLSWTTNFLREKGVASPRLDAEVLLAHALSCRRPELYVRHSEEVSEEARALFRGQIKERVAGCPVAYLVGEKEFFLLPFKVTRDTLIPRSETEGLVTEVLSRLKNRPGAKLVDVGTGSGCIAITLAKKLKDAEVTAIDLSPAALAVAAENAVHNGVAGRVRFLEGDLLSPVMGEAFDVIVSNPPYVTSAEYATLDRGVRDFEPREALEAGLEGLDVYRPLILQALAALNTSGALMLEIGPGVEAGVCDLLGEGWKLRPTIQDGAGLPRIIFAERLR